ncbi:MAG TPA: aldehyde dehydrogenase family protein, partial [Nitrospiria bacterium]|nr:aldehyde dehydrogenase family protein [Nitrospiria bacterium]
NGITADVWMEAGVSVSGLGNNMASFYREKDPRGEVALVLGAGNLNCIAPYDALYRLYAQGQVVLLKMNPVNDYLMPFLTKIFEPLLSEGFLQIASGGPDVGHALVFHDAVEAIHLTGSAQTFDAIVFGTGAEGENRKREKRPLLNKPITGETGGVSPLVILPGRWSKADIRFQAENAVSMKLHNSGFNCVAAQVLVLPDQWDQKEEFLEAIRNVFRELPARSAWYPGAAERQMEAVSRYPSAEIYQNDLSRIFITDIAPDRENESAFSSEFFGPVLAQTSLPGRLASEYLTNAVRFCNERLTGSLGATLIAHPATIRKLGPALEEAIAGLRYGSIGVNVWTATTFLLPQAPWAPWRGSGVTHNTFLFDSAEKSVCYGSFFPFPRGLWHRSFSLMPKPPWFVANKTAHLTGERMTRFAINPGWRHLPGIIWAAVRG